ncbi:MAG: transcriptional repressor [Clostridia bacterium]|nr:transcriptional repressor [Clostridia bacterium]
MKNTKQRTIIIQILQKAKKPLSANDIFNRATKIQPNIALTTIYRNLEMLYENDLIIRYRIEDKEYCYELKRKNHTHYLICKNCRKKVDLPECPLKELEKNISNSTGFKITSHNLELEGYCDKCK